MKKYSTVLVANRLPVKVSKANGELSYSQSDGGLPTALSSLESPETLYIGWPGIAADELTDEDKKDIVAELAKRNCYPVFLTAEDIALFYEGYANDTLWPLFHYYQAYMINHDEYWKSYEHVNRMYRDAVAKFAEEDARVWVHDYQLMLLPAMVRAKLPKSLIGYFHHVPYPSFEVFRALPQRREIIEGLLGADLVGFHIYDYARHFLSSCLRLLGIPNDYGMLHVDGRLVRADSFPISIDYDRFVQMRSLPDVTSQYESLLESYEGQKIIFSVDRLDYSKGIPDRLEAYRRFLENNPEFLGQVVHIMVVSPSRTGVETYQNLQVEIDKAVSRINGEFGSAEWMPIVYQSQTLSLEEIVPLSMAADVMLITPRRDGMNLVAKEYVAIKGDIPGVLVLSELAGVYEELPESLAINPYDTLGTSKVIKKALTMSKREQLDRLSAMQERIKDYPVTRWAKDYMAALEEVRRKQEESSIESLSGSKLTQLKESYDGAKERVVMLDYDGTIQTFKNSPDPSAARPSEKVHTLINTIASDPHTRLCIISGRSKAALDSWFGDTNAQLIAEHGAWVKRAGKWHKRDIEFEDAREAAMPVLENYTARTPGSRIERKDFAMVWHYRNVSPELALVRAYNLRHELKAAVNEYDVDVHQGNKIIELKPVGVSKRIAVQALLGEYDASFVLVAGDDYTDEDMFEVSPHESYTIKVGPGETAANYRVSNVAAMVRVLEKIAEKTT